MIRPLNFLTAKAKEPDHLLLISIKIPSNREVAGNLSPLKASVLAVFPCNTRARALIILACARVYIRANTRGGVFLRCPSNTLRACAILIYARMNVLYREYILSREYARIAIYSSIVMAPAGLLAYPVPAPLALTAALLPLGQKRGEAV